MEAVAAVTSTYTGIMSKYSGAFQTFIMALGEARSKAEEDRIIKEAIFHIKSSMKKPDITIKQKKEQLIQLMYCSMLGHDVSFGHIAAVNFIQQPKYIHLAEKRVGYAALLMFCDDSDEMECTMNLNNMIKDLNSNQTTEVCFALNAASQLIFKEILPAISPLVERLVKHSDEQIRKKAVMTLLKFYQLDPDENSHLKKLFYEALKDPSASVMSVTLNIFHTFILEEGAEKYRNLTSTFVCLLKQVLNNQVPREMSYKKVPAPWLQIKLLQILGLLGKGNLEESQKMYEILKVCLNATNTSLPIYCAIAAECLKTISKIYPHDLLIEMSVVRAGSFLVSQNYNLKYLGISAMQDIVEIDAGHATKYQMEMINCLNDHDETLKWKTLVLLYKMANVSNVTLICDKMLKYLRSTLDQFIRVELVNKITELAEKYAPDNEWYIETMNEVFRVAGDLVSKDTLYNMMLLLGEGLEDDSETDDLRRHAVISYVEMLRNPTLLPDVLVQLISWVLGEYMRVIESYDVTETLQSLYMLLKKEFKDPDTKTWIASAIVKLLSQQKNWLELLEPVQYLSYAQAEETYNEMLNSLEIYQDEIGKIFPYDESCDEVDFDQMFVAIDNHVNNALANGMKPYCEESKRNKLEICDDSKKSPLKDGTLIFVHSKQEDPYTNSSVSTLKSVTPETTPVKSLHEHSSKHHRKPANKPVWGTSGRITKTPPVSSNSSECDLSSDPATDTLSSGSTSQHTDSSKDVLDRNLQQTSTKENILTESQREAGHLFGGISSSRSKHSVYSMRAKGKTPRKNRTGDLINMIDSNDSVPQNTKNIDDSLPRSTQNIKTPCTNDILVKLTENSNITDGTNLFEGLDFENGNVDSTQEFQAISEGIKKKASITSDILIDSTIDAQRNTDLVENIPESSVDRNEENQISNESTGISSENIDDLFDGLDFPHNEIQDPTGLTLQREEQCTATGETVKTIDVSPNPFNFIDKEENAMEIPENLKSYPFSKEKFHLSTDNNFRVTCQFVYKPTCTVLVLFLFNQTAQTVNDIKLSIKPPTNLKVTEDSSLSCDVAELLTMTSFHHMIQLKLQHPALNMELSGHVTYKDFRNLEKRIYLQQKLQFSILLRPLVLIRDDYEKKWLIRSLYEKREKLPVKMKVKVLVSLLEEKCSIHVVQVIGQDFIASTSVLDEQEILLYFSAKENILMSMKSGSKQLNNCVVKMLTDVITSYNS